LKAYGGGLRVGSASDPTYLATSLSESIRKRVCRLSELLRLLPAHFANDWHVISGATNPKPEKKLSALFVEFDIVPQPSSPEISNRKAMFKEMQCAHLSLRSLAMRKSQSN
jgi:hypothetical protein